MHMQYSSLTFVAVFNTRSGSRANGVKSWMTTSGLYRFSAFLGLRLFSVPNPSLKPSYPFEG